MVRMYKNTDELANVRVTPCEKLHDIKQGKVKMCGLKFLIVLQAQ